MFISFFIGYGLNRLASCKRIVYAEVKVFLVHQPGAPSALRTCVDGSYLRITEGNAQTFAVLQTEYEAIVEVMEVVKMEGVQRSTTKASELGTTCQFRVSPSPPPLPTSLLLAGLSFLLKSQRTDVEVRDVPEDVLLTLRMSTLRGDEHSPPAAKKRRIPKACASCRRSKLRCDEQRPCSRCINAGTECIYYARPKDPMAERMMALESQVSELTERLEAASSSTSPSIPPGPVQSMNVQGAQHASVTSMSEPGRHSGNLARFSVRQVTTIDVVARGLISEADARSLFSVFFEGCVVISPCVESSDLTAVAARWSPTDAYCTS